MANRIIINETDTRQSQKSEITYSINFTESQEFPWCLGATRYAAPKCARVLRELFYEFSTIMRNGKMNIEVMDEDSSD